MRLRKTFSAFLICFFFLSLGASQSFAVTPVERSWILAGMDGYEIHSVAIDPTNQNTVYVGTSNNGIYKSTDGGATWTAINNGIPNYAAGYITDVVVDPNSSNILYAGGVGINNPNETGLFKSTDGGMTWNVSDNGFVDVGFGAQPFDVHNIIIDHEDSNILYVAIGSACGSVYKTVNGGDLWTRGVGLPCDPVAVRQDPSDPDILYTGNDQGIFNSTDRGATWNQIATTQTTGGLAIDPLNTNILYSSNFSGIYKSTDYGVTWTLSDNGMTQVYKALLSDPILAGTIYSGQDRGVATGANVSSDGGTSWNSMNNGLPNVGVKRLLISPANMNLLYAGTENGLFVYGFDGLNNPPVLQSLQDVTISRNQTYTANGSFTDADSTSWTATVNYGDGGGNEPLPLNPDKTFTLSHQYSAVDQYTVTVTITDNQNESDEETAVVTVIIPDPVATTFTASADTYVKSGQDNRNVGGGTFMRLQSSGDNRSLVRFDQATMQNEIGNNEVLSAKLRVTIVDNGNNWGTTGRTIDVHRLVAGWSEGNGTENVRGTGAGATWECATDSNIANQAKDCTGNNVWEMGQPNNPAVHPWLATASATQTITNDQTGVVEFDVTTDVQAFMNGTSNNGWIIKKTNEGQNGQVSFGTKESASVPQLVVTYQP